MKTSIGFTNFLVIIKHKRMTCSSQWENVFSAWPHNEFKVKLDNLMSFYVYYYFGFEYSKNDILQFKATKPRDRRVLLRLHGIFTNHWHLVFFINNLWEAGLVVELEALEPEVLGSYPASAQWVLSIWLSRNPLGLSSLK